MTNDDRDKKISETHTAVMVMTEKFNVMTEKVDEHHTTLYGNGDAGLKEDMALTIQRQEDCPARKAATTEGKRLSLATAALVIAVISCIASAVAVVSKLVGP